MKNPQPFITTDELREEFYKIFFNRTVADEYLTEYCVPKHIADYWLQKMSEHKERLIKDGLLSSHSKEVV